PLRLPSGCGVSPAYTSGRVNANGDFGGALVSWRALQCFLSLSHFFAPEQLSKDHNGECVCCDQAAITKIATA
ncbi:MAG: hypothetical protein QGF59_29930, partial [Pirellulaceae bacterium]|nr:hypothetical protein [Pirellulaceae bacterium]